MWIVVLGRVRQHVLLHLADHEEAVHHLLQGVVVDGVGAVPHGTVGHARPFRLQVEQVVLVADVLGTANTTDVE